MTEYRRNFVKGGSYFFTVALAYRSQRLLVQHIDSLREAFRCVKAEHSFVLDAMVVLPEHLHCIWTLPTGDANYPDRWRRIKAAFSRSLPDCNFRSRSKILKGERGIWQRRYWEHYITQRGRLAASYGLHPLQSSETSACSEGCQLAVFNVSSLC
jgi:putative transposase